MAPRCLGVLPTASHSASLSTPRPKAGSIRPSLRKSMVASSLARTIGSRTGNTATLMPNLVRLVRPAIMARVVMGSRDGAGFRIRSFSQMESSPLVSTRSTKFQKSLVRSNGQPEKPTPMRIFITASPRLHGPSARECTGLLQPGPLRLIEQRSDGFPHVLVIAFQPDALHLSKLSPVDQTFIKR